MVGSCKIITQRLGRIAPQKDAAGIFNSVQQCKRLLHAQFQMLRRNDIGCAHRIVHALTEDDLSVFVNAFPRNIRVKQLRCTANNFLIYKIKWAVLVAYQEEEKQEPLKKFFVVLLMRHQIPECLSFKMASHVAHLIRGFSECHNGLQEAL